MLGRVERGCSGGCNEVALKMISIQRWSERLLSCRTTAAIEVWTLAPLLSNFRGSNNTQGVVSNQG